MERIRESEEMYLETILILSQSKSGVHAIDVCEALNYARSSVSRGMSLLKKRGFIEVDGDEHIQLTEEGRAKAESIYERHSVLTKMFLSLGATPECAEENACRIEHVITDELFEILKQHNDIHS